MWGIGEEGSEEAVGDWRMEEGNERWWMEEIDRWRVGYGGMAVDFSSAVAGGRKPLNARHRFFHLKWHEDDDIKNNKLKKKK